MSASRINRPFNRAGIVCRHCGADLPATVPWHDRCFRCAGSGRRDYMGGAQPAQPGLRIIACGWRRYRDGRAVFRALDLLHVRRGVAWLMQGAADGADYLAWQWAEWRGCQGGSYAADWQGEGRAAGPRRNARMLAEGAPDAVVVFPGDVGTLDMASRAQAAGVPLWFPVRFEHWPAELQAKGAPARFAALQQAARPIG